MTSAHQPPGQPYRVQRLDPSDRILARKLFSMMAEVFEEEHQELSDEYIDRLLARADFWAVVARVADEIVGGLTAHVLPMTRAETQEVFIYDVAVRTDHQRRGVGKLLMRHLQQAAGSAGAGDLFVPADNEDVHAIEFYRALGGEAAPVTFFTFSAQHP